MSKGGLILGVNVGGMSVEKLLTSVYDAMKL